MGTASERGEHRVCAYIDGGFRSRGRNAVRRPNDTPNQLRAAPGAKSDAARQLPRLTIALAEGELQLP
jgi:hypothetical protein